MSLLQKHKVFLISGLGADRTAFMRLKLEHAITSHIDWIEPFRNESFSSYCSRLIEGKGITNQDILIGLSLGGMVAQEIACQVPVKKVLLISSIKDHSEKPLYFHFFRFFPIYKLIPAVIMIKFLPFISGLLRRQDVVKNKMFKEMLERSNKRFFKWGIHQAVNFKRSCPLSNIYHIHGTNDLIIHSGRIREFHKVEGGNHFMVVQKGDEISAWLNKHII